MAEETRFFQASPAIEGKPARSGAAMREVLERVRRNQPRGDLAGPLTGGLRGDDWLALAAFYNPAEAQRLRSMLDAGGIAVRIERQRRLRMVLVKFADRERANPIVLEHAIDAHDSSLWRKERTILRRKVAGATHIAGGLQAAMRRPPVARPTFRAPRRPCDRALWRKQRADAWKAVGCICGAAFGPNLAALGLWAVANGSSSVVAFLFAGLLGIPLGASAGRAFGVLAGKIECG
jgi:hypothetical protein